MIMIKIKNKDIKVNGHWFDYELEDGTMLHSSEWNGEEYIIAENNVEITYRPIYTEEENSNGGYDIIGFENI